MHKFLSEQRIYFSWINPQKWCDFFMRNCQTHLLSGCTILHFHKERTSLVGLCFLAILVRVSHRGFNVLFPNSNDVEHLCMGLFDFSISSLMKSLFKSFCPFLIELLASYS